MDVLTSAAAVLLAAGLVGALVGSAGYTLLVERRQNGRLARLAARLARAQDEGAIVALEAERIQDPRLRAAFRDLADRVADTWRLATIDPLTGIANRQAVLARLEEELDRANRYRRQLSVIIIDLDHFKRLNDAHGHAAGDVVLRHVGQQLAASVRSVDFAGRYGGEEFLVVLPETGPDAAASLAEKLRRAVGGGLVRLPEGEVVSVSLSAGVAGGQGEVLQLDALVRDADAALYSAKALGRGQVYVFRETGDDGTIRRAPISAEARERALDVGRDAMSAARDALLAELAGREAWAGKPSTLIAEASVALARAVDLPGGELDRIRTASLLHDLGKLAIPDEILGRPGDLAMSEWRVVTEHPKIGQVVLEQAGALRDAANIVLHHHEWFDGRGYPHGLAGSDIPVGARIVSIVDAYEAMIAGRPYRAGDLARRGAGRAPPPGGRPVRPRPRRGVRRPVRRRRAVAARGARPRSSSPGTITRTSRARSPCTGRWAPPWPPARRPLRPSARPQPAAAAPGPDAAGARARGRPPRSTTPSTTAGGGPARTGLAGAAKAARVLRTRPSVGHDGDMEPGSHRRDIVLLFTTRSLRMFAYGFLAVVLVLYLQAVGLSGAEVGLLLALTLLGDAAISLLLTTRADRFGRRKTLFLGSLLMLGAGLVFASSTLFPVLLVAATLGVLSPSGNEVGPFLAIEQASLAQLVDARARTATFARYQVAGSVSTALGSLAAGTMTQLVLGAGAAPADAYRTVIAAYAVVGLVMAFLFPLLSRAVEIAAPAAPAAGATVPRTRLGLHKSRGIVGRLAALFALDAFGGGFVMLGFISFWLTTRSTPTPRSSAGSCSAPTSSPPCRRSPRARSRPGSGSSGRWSSRTCPRTCC